MDRVSTDNSIASTTRGGGGGTVPVNVAEVEARDDAALARCKHSMCRELLDSGFEACFGPSAQGAGIRYQNTSQIQILLASHFKKKGRDVRR